MARTKKLPAAQAVGRRLPPSSGRFQKGKSGNPKGKNGSDARREFERCVLRLLHEKGEALAEALLEKAMTDARFMALVLDRVMPVPRHVVLEANVGLTVAADLGALEARLARQFHLRAVSGGASAA